MSDKPDIHDSRGSSNPSFGSGTSEFGEGHPTTPEQTPGNKESSCKTVCGHLATTEKSVKQGSLGQSGGTRHLDKSRQSGKSGQSDELW